MAPRRTPARGQAEPDTDPIWRGLDRDDPLRQRIAELTEHDIFSVDEEPPRADTSRTYSPGLALWLQLQRAADMQQLEAARESARAMGKANEQLRAQMATLTSSNAQV